MHSCTTLGSGRSVTARHSSSGRQPNFEAWNTEIRQGGHHVVLQCHIIMAALWNWAGHYIFALWFLSLYLSSFFLA